MTTQLEALRLADEQERWLLVSAETRLKTAAELRRLHKLVEHLQLTVFGFETKLATRGYEIQIDDLKGEVRRLHEVNQELLEALKVLVENGGIGPEDMFDDARAAIAKATGEQA